MENTTDQIKTDEIKMIDSEVPVYQQQQRAEIDSQIATAKAYPRDLRRCVENAIITVTMSRETAASCGYELPRGTKKIKGPSVHLAAILAQNYGNLRAEARVSEVSAKYVSAEAVAFDLETNYAFKIEVRRKILDRYGKRYNDDMIHTTGLAAAAVAYRNAILRIVPRAITDKVYKAAQNMITGDLSDEQKLLKARTTWIKTYKSKYEATEDEILSLCGVKAVTGINQDQIATLIGVDQAIKDGDTTIDEALLRNKGENRDGEKVAEKDFSNDKPEEGGTLNMK